MFHELLSFIERNPGISFVIALFILAMMNTIFPIVLVKRNKDD